MSVVAVNTATFLVFVANAVVVAAALGVAATTIVAAAVVVVVAVAIGVAAIFINAVVVSAVFGEAVTPIAPVVVIVPNFVVSFPDAFVVVTTATAVSFVATTAALIAGFDSPVLVAVVAAIIFVTLADTSISATNDCLVVTE